MLPLRYQALDRGQINLTDGYTTDAHCGNIIWWRCKMIRVVSDLSRCAIDANGLCRRHPQLVAALNKLAGQLHEKQMQTMNYAVSVKNEKAATVAHRYLVQHGLLKEVR